MSNPVLLEIDGPAYRKLQRQLSTVKKSVRTKATRKAIREVVKFGVADVKATLAPRVVTGATRKSIKSDVRTKRGTVIGRVGQQRTKTYKLGKRVLKKHGRSLSPIQAAGKPTPIHFFEGIEPHQINAAKDKKLRFSVGGRMVSVKSVRHPGTRPNSALAPTHRKVRRLAPLVFQRVVKETLRAAT
jgi:hypothetical protein